MVDKVEIIIFLKKKKKGQSGKERNRLNLLLIGKSKCPKAIKNVKNVSMTYMNQTKAWITTNTFMEW
jgi:hypothetical protein